MCLLVRWLQVLLRIFSRGLILSIRRLSITYYIILDMIQQKKVQEEKKQKHRLLKEMERYKKLPWLQMNWEEE
jgi:hypothetical protein